jgi:cephalosporin-C deacetylase-like acetyl esterase
MTGKSVKKRVFGYTSLVLITGFLLWYFFIALKPVEIPQEEIVNAYRYPPIQTESVELKELDPNSFEITFRSFDGSIVNGQISYPENNEAMHPVVVGVSAMGRNYNRWWVDSFKGRPTVTNVNKLGKAALESGYAVVAIDARYHGSRKDPDRTLRSIMNDLHFFGDKSTYEEMIVNTVRDYRVLLDWLESQNRIDSRNIVMAGYSMGGEVALLTASVDDRVNHVVAIVPPYLDDKVALVAPKNVVSLLDSAQVLLITSDDDENASEEENLSLFDEIATAKKDHLIFEGTHILPARYVESVRDWLVDARQDQRIND